MQISLVVMLSGKAERFGENKLLTELWGRPVYRYALRQAAESGADHVTLVTGFEEIALYCKDHYPTASVVMNRHPERGISESLKIGLRHEMEMTGDGRGPEGCCFLVGDQPLLQPSSLRALLESFRRNPDRIFLLSDGEHEGNPAVFPASFFPLLLALEGDHGGRQLIGRFPERTDKVMTRDSLELYDIDTKEDLMRICDHPFKHMKS